jgi:phospholipase/carboxylesterase
MDRPTAVSDLPPIVIEPATGAGAAVIWLHGLGADGHDFEPIVPALDLPPGAAVRFVFPHAPYRTVTINNGLRMRAWYDITGSEMARQEDERGIRASAAEVQALINQQCRSGIPADRIVLAGFSQGGAIALHSALRHPAPLAGVVALSTYLPLAERLEREADPANRSIPILMVHGTDDGVIPLFMAERSRRRLAELGYPVDWHAYAMEHCVIGEEIALISAWLSRRLGLKTQSSRPL